MEWIDQYESELWRKRAAQEAVQAEFDRRASAFDTLRSLLTSEVNTHVDTVSRRLGIDFVVHNYPTAQYVVHERRDTFAALLFYATSETPAVIGVACWLSTARPSAGWGDPRSADESAPFVSKTSAVTIPTDVDALFHWLSAVALDNTAPTIMLASDHERVRQRHIASERDELCQREQRTAEMAMGCSLAGILFPVGVIGWFIGNLAHKRLLALNADTGTARRAIIAGRITTFTYVTFLLVGIFADRCQGL